MSNIINFASYRRTPANRDSRILFSQEVEAFHMESMTECKATIEVLASGKFGLSITFPGGGILCALLLSEADALAEALRGEF